MAINNTITLIGNMGSEVRIVHLEGKKSFASISLATTDSYKDQEGNWQDKEIIWHDVIAFNPNVIKQLESFKTGTRLEIIGSLSYREFQVNDEGKVITKREASIIANKVEQKPLVRKRSQNNSNSFGKGDFFRALLFKYSCVISMFSGLVFRII